MDRAPYEHLGAEGVERLTELGRGFLFTAAANGAFPAEATGR
ncbi:SalK OS=Streptomyces cyaneofuscatus OX=66883 GN=G3I52_29430 PE=4 SV=1 [Streptomyces cyaneofuscatus]